MQAAELEVAVDPVNAVDLKKLVLALQEFNEFGKTTNFKVNEHPWSTLKYFILSHDEQYPHSQYFYELTPDQLSYGISQLKADPATPTFSFKLDQFLAAYEADLRKYAVHLDTLEAALNGIAENSEKIKTLRAAEPKIWLEQIMAAHFEGPSASLSYIFEIPSEQLRDDLAELKKQNRIPDSEELPAEWLLELVGTDGDIKLYRAFNQLLLHAKKIRPEVESLAYGDNLVTYLIKHKDVYPAANYLLSLSPKQVKEGLAQLRATAGDIVDFSGKGWDWWANFYESENKKFNDYEDHLVKLFAALSDIAEQQRKSPGKLLAAVIEDAAKHPAHYNKIAYLFGLTQLGLDHLISDIAKLQNRKEKINAEELKNILVAHKAKPQLAVTAADFIQALVTLQHSLSLSRPPVTLTDIILQEFENNSKGLVSSVFRTMNVNHIAAYMKRFDDERAEKAEACRTIKVNEYELTRAVQEAQLKMIQKELNQAKKKEDALRAFATALTALSKKRMEPATETLSSLALNIDYFTKIHSFDASKLMDEYLAASSLHDEFPVPDNITAEELDKALEEVQLELLNRRDAQQIRQQEERQLQARRTNPFVGNAAPAGSRPPVTARPSFWSSINAGQKTGLLIGGFSLLTAATAGVTALTSLNTMTLGTVVNTLGFKFVLNATLSGMTVPLALLATAGALAVLAGIICLLSTLAKQCGRNNARAAYSPINS